MTMKTLEGMASLLRRSLRRAAECLSMLNADVVTAVAVGVLLAWIWSQVTVVAGKRDQQAVAAAQQESANIAAVVAEHASRTLAELNHIAALAKARYGELGSKFDADAFVKEVGIDRTLVYAIIITDANGVPVAFSDGVRPGSFAKRAEFQQHRSERRGHIIARPLFGKVIPRWVLPVTWRLERTDGSFDGIISIGVNPYYFIDLFRKIDIGSKGVISLVGTDGILRARLFEGKTTFGHDISQARVMAAARTSDSGAVEHTALVDGEHRYYSFRRVPNQPLHVIVGRSRATVLAASSRERTRAYFQAAGATFAILAVALTLGYLRRRQLRLNRALDLEQSKQRAILESIADPAWLKDAEGRIVAINPAFERVFSTRAADVIGSTQSELLCRACASGMKSCPCSSGVPCNGQRCEVELNARGNKVWLETSTAPIVADGRITGTAGTARDITLRKHLEHELKESHDRLQRALDHSAMAVWEWHVESGRLIHTEGLARMLGYPAGYVIATRNQWVDHIHPDDRRRINAAMRRCLAQHGEYSEEYRVRGGDGLERWMHVRGAVTRKRVLEDAVIVSGILQDVSDRKRAENALRDSEQRFRVLVENMNDIFWIANPGLDSIQYLSPGFQRTLGVAPELLYENPALWPSFIHADDLATAKSFVAAQIRGEASGCEVRMRNVLGEYRWMVVRSVPWRDASGALLCAGMAEDITERKQADEDRLRHAVRQRDALVMEVHHRIKNNLQGVLGLLEEQKHADPTTRTMLRTLANRIQSVATVHGLQGRRTGSMIFLGELVRAIAENLRGLGEAQIEIDTTAFEEDVQIKERESVPVALILNELIWNALKHSTQSPKMVRVRIDADAVDEVTLAIVNQGTISETVACDARLSGGLGLGLIRALMPPRGARLTLDAAGSDVCATLVLSEPVIDVRSLRAAA